MNYLKPNSAEKNNSDPLFQILIRKLTLFLPRMKFFNLILLQNYGVQVMAIYVFLIFLLNLIDNGSLIGRLCQKFTQAKIFMIVLLLKFLVFSNAVFAHIDYVLDSWY